MTVNRDYTNQNGNVTLICGAVNSCRESTITGISTIFFHDLWSASNSTVISGGNGITINIYTTQTVYWGFKVYCNNSETFNIYCDGKSSCNSLIKLYCYPYALVA